MISADVVLGNNVVIPHPELVNLYGCRIGDNSKVGSFVETLSRKSDPEQPKQGNALVNSAVSCFLREIGL